VVLGVDGEHPGWADDEVVDIGMFSDWKIVKGREAR